MKRILISSIIFILFLANNSKAQDYHKLLDSNLYWDVASASMGYICGGYSDYPPLRFTISDDTVINNLSYSKFGYYKMYPSMHNPPPNCPPFFVDTLFYDNVAYYMREDTLNHKVYMYNSYEETEYLWYDFDAQIGDTITYPYYGEFIVDTIYDIITNDGKIRKYFECNYGWHGFYIEGLGGISGPFYEPFAYFESGAWLMCAKEHDGQSIWGSDCYDFTTDITEQESEAKLNVYPNPASNFIHIELSATPAEINIYNSHGLKIITTIAANKTNTINLSQIDSGIYYLVVLEESGLIISRKIIKLD